MQFLQRSNATLTQLDKTDKGIANQFRYLQKQASYPTYTHTDVQFYSDASDGLEAQLRDLDKAEHFIFMDYMPSRTASLSNVFPVFLHAKLSKALKYVLCMTMVDQSVLSIALS